MLSRLQSLLGRCLAGDELTLAYLGGSITQGSLASAAETCYAARVTRWFRETFPQSLFHSVNGGIGGTNSHYGVSRAVTDVLMDQPDLVIIDFSVNDVAGSEGFDLTPTDPTAFFSETFEGLLRRVLSWPSRPAVLLLCNIQYADGMTMEDAHVRVASHYRIPHVSIRDTIYARLRNGTLSQESITPDGLHPNDLGHALVADEITRVLKRMLKACPGDLPRDLPCESSLPDPLTANRFESARRLTIREISPALAGFRADTAQKTGFLDHFTEGWIGSRTGDRIRFELDELSTLAVQYRKTIRTPACVARLSLDGKPALTLDGNFRETWGDCLYMDSILLEHAPARHTVELDITDDAGGTATPFYLMSLIVS